MSRDVLIVDDSLTVRMDLQEAFAAAGFEPVLCADLRCARAAVDSRGYALFVLDVLLPDGDGVEFLEELRAHPLHADTPVIMLSTEAEVRHRIRGLRTGADDYVGKPYDAAYVIARAHDLVRRSAPAAPGGAGPVLVVDDSITAREELRASLEAAGHEVVTASTGEEGLRTAADRRPRAVLVDGVMPGIDGPTFIRQLRADPVLRTTPCILLTASAGGELGALEAGADAYVRKEDGHEVVIARLNALLRSSTPPGAVVGASGLLSPKRILVVAPGEAPLQELVDRLRQDGHEVIAATVTDSLALLGVDRSVDGIIVDAARDFDEALATCRTIKADATWREIPLLVVASGAEHARMLDAVNAGADDYVSLSAGLEVVRARVRAQLRRKQFEDENRTRDAFARNAAILETIADGFCAVDQQWRFVYVNHAFEEFLRAPRAELEGELLWDRCTWLGEEQQRQLRRAAEERVAVTFEAQTPSERWFEVRAFPHGQGLSAYVRDVTERHRSQEVQAHMMGIVGHDLRTPLAVISTSAEIVLRDPALTERQRRAMERTTTSVARMTRLIADLLDYSRARLGQGLRLARREIDLDRLCRDVIDEVKASHGNRTIRYESPGAFIGEWDPDRVQQVIGNLLTNALRYSPTTTEVHLRIGSADGSARIVVHNEGAPIAPEIQPHIFEPFRRGQDRGAWGGVGLGLYIVKQIVLAHGGTVSLRSEAGAGTTFTVMLPGRSADSTGA